MANYRRVWPTGSLGERFGTLGMNQRTLGEVVAGVHRTLEPRAVSFSHDASRDIPGSERGSPPRGVNCAKTTASSLRDAAT